MTWIKLEHGELYNLDCAEMIWVSSTKDNQFEVVIRSVHPIKYPNGNIEINIWKSGFVTESEAVKWMNVNFTYAYMNHLLPEAKARDHG